MSSQHHKLNIQKMASEARIEEVRNSGSHCFMSFFALICRERLFVCIKDDIYIDTCMGSGHILALPLISRWKFTGSVAIQIEMLQLELHKTIFSVLVLMGAVFISLTLRL